MTFSPLIRPILSLERLSFSEKEGKVTYRYGEGAEEVERFLDSEAPADYFS